MKLFFSLILAVILAVAVASSVVSGTMAGFFDTATSDQNYMCAGTINLELEGECFTVGNMIPDKWYSREKLLVNAGTLDAAATVHLKNLRCVEDAPRARIATTEIERVAEEGGKIGQKRVQGLGVDICNIADYIDTKLWYDGNDDGQFELIAQGKLVDLICQTFRLGIIPGNTTMENTGGGWGAYFTYFIGNPKTTVPLMMGQNTPVGTVSVWTTNGKLYIKYDTGSSGWRMKETHVYVGSQPPASLAPGRFPYKHLVPPPYTIDVYEIPQSWSGTVYIAAHAAGKDCETAWATGITRRFKMETRFPDIPEGMLGYNYFNEMDPNEVQWEHWPTNAYQGDSAIFDTEFLLNSISGSNAGPYKGSDKGSGKGKGKGK